MVVLLSSVARSDRDRYFSTRLNGNAETANVNTYVLRNLLLGGGVGFLIACAQYGK